jgi:hypothetical protein
MLWKLSALEVGHDSNGGVGRGDARTQLFGVTDAEKCRAEYVAVAVDDAIGSALARARDCSAEVAGQVRDAVDEAWWQGEDVACHGAVGFGRQRQWAADGHLGARHPPI